MQAMTEEPVDLPTIKNAGRLNYTHGYDAMGATVVAVLFGLLAVGAMLQALMTNHGRSLRGLALNGLAGAVALAIFAGVIAVAGPPFAWNALLGVGVIIGGCCLVLAILAFAVGSLVASPGKSRRRA